MPLFSWQSCFLASFLFANYAAAFTGSEYSLTHEYSGLNFFEGWDFYTGRDPTGGFVTYYSRSSAQLTDLIRTSEDGPAYMGVNYVDKLPFDEETGQGTGAGRPSVRIASKQAFTHGLFIGDFEHIPAGVCGTWPAFWTLGPNWPYTGEIDILEGVNANMNNVMSLHTNETCIIDGDMSTMTGLLENTNCAYYPDYNVGCGVKDDRATSFGVGFNQAGGGVYAMQWTSDYINIWHWPRSEVPADVDSKSPDPGSWSLPAAQLGVGNCTIDQHFQSHKIIFDTTFCGDYAGNPYVWKTDDANSCQKSTGLPTCNNYVANNPEAFEEAYWGVNYVRVYQLFDPESESPSATYIASEQPLNTATNLHTSAPAVVTPNFDADSLCPQYNFSIISDGKYQYEIACDFDPPGPDIVGPPYAGFTANSMADCITGCSYMNENNGTNSCGGVSHFAGINFCYFKKYIDGTPAYRKGYNEIRLIFYGYPQITDDPRNTPDSTLTSIFVETIPTPQTYRPLTTTSIMTSTTLASSSTMTTTDSRATTFPPAMGDNSSSTSTLPDDYSETVTSGYNATSTTTSSSPPTSITSTNPEVTGAEFLIAFNVPPATLRLSKRAVRYLAFDDDGQSILVTSEDEAARFYLDAEGSVKSGTQFVDVDTTVEPSQFTLQGDKPDEPVNIKIDGSGNVSVEGYEGFCLTSNGSLVVVEVSEEEPAECLPVEPELVKAPTDTSTSTLSTSATSISSSATTSTLTSSTSSMTLSTTSDIPTEGSESSTAGKSTTSKASGTPSSFESGSITSSSTTSTPTAPEINDFVYAGCFAIPQDFRTLTGISLPLTDDAMNNDKCTTYCQNLNAYYAGTHEKQCFCGTNIKLYATLLDYPDASCNSPCPGSNREMCGGNSMFEAGGIPTTSIMTNKNKHKRQTGIVLISLYNNTKLLPQPGESNAPTGLDTTTVTDTIMTRPTNSDDGLGFPTNSISYNVTGTNAATVISTTYVDVCPVCPGGLATRATTITVPYCGCTATYDADLHTTVIVPSPSVPMVTTVKDCACGHQGAQSTITVTVPHTSSIHDLAAMVTQQIAPGVAAGAGALASASAYAAASASGSTGTSPQPMSEGKTSSAAPANISPPANAAVAPPGAAVAPQEAASAQDGFAPPPVPVSPPSAAENPAQTSSYGPMNPVNGAVVNATLPQDYRSGGNGTVPGLNAPIQTFKSSSSRILVISWVESRYRIGLLVGVFVVGVVSAW